MGLSGLEPPTSRLSGVRSNRLSYKPIESGIHLLSHAVSSIVPSGTEAVYQDTFGYTHVFRPVNEGREIRLSNRFMRQKGIRILPAETNGGK